MDFTCRHGQNSRLSDLEQEVFHLRSLPGSGKDVPKHDCTDNFSGSSTVMERGAAVEMFSRSNSFSLTYRTFVSGENTLFSSCIQNSIYTFLDSTIGINLNNLFIINICPY